MRSPKDTEALDGTVFLWLTGCVPRSPFCPETSTCVHKERTGPLRADLPRLVWLQTDGNNHREREDLAFSEGPPAAAIVTFCALLPSSAGVELHLGSPGLIIRGGATLQLVRYLGRSLEKGGLGSSQQKEKLNGLS